MKAVSLIGNGSSQNNSDSNRARRAALHSRLSRKIRHQQMAFCVTAAGGAHCPLAPSAQHAALDLFQHQVRDGIDLQIEIVPSPYVTSVIFERYIDTVLIPAIESNQELPGCAKKPVILFCDNCSSHMSDSILRKLARHGVLVTTYPCFISIRWLRRSQ
jgi:hypothetical protein